MCVTCSVGKPGGGLSSGPHLTSRKHSYPTTSSCSVFHTEGHGARKAQPQGNKANAIQTVMWDTISTNPADLKIKRERTALVQKTAAWPISPIQKVCVLLLSQQSCWNARRAAEVTHRGLSASCLSVSAACKVVHIFGLSVQRLKQPASILNKSCDCTVSAGHASYRFCGWVALCSSRREEQPGNF